MSTRKLIGKVSATEKNPSSCDEFQFWMSDDTILSPFDIVLVQNKTDDSITYGVVQDMLKHEDELSSIVEKYRSKTPKARYLDFNQGVDGRKINDDNMTQLARLAIKPLRIAFDDIKLKDTYCAAVRTAHRHGIKEISNYILLITRIGPRISMSG